MTLIHPFSLGTVESHIARGVILSYFCLLTNYSSDGFRDPINGRFHAGPRASLLFSKGSRSGRSLFRSNCDFSNVKPIFRGLQVVKLLACLLASFPELILILGEMNSEATLWNQPPSVNSLAGSEKSLVLTWSATWNMMVVGNSDVWQLDILVGLAQFQHGTISRRR
jgi:hypothetical protein